MSPLTIALIAVGILIVIVGAFYWLALWAVRQGEMMPPDVRASSSVRSWPCGAKLRDESILHKELPTFYVEVPFYRIKQWSDREFWKVHAWYEARKRGEFPALPKILVPYVNTHRLSNSITE